MKKLLFCGLLLLAACSETKQTSQHIVEYNPDKWGNGAMPQEVFASMEVLSFEMPEEVLLSGDNDVIWDNGRFFVVDNNNQSCIFIFDANRRYLGSVDAKGRGGNEYLNINNVQVIGDQVAVYSSLNKALYYYNMDGSFAEKDTLEYAPAQLIKTGDNYWGYAGFSNGKMDERVVKMDAEGQIIGKYMPSDAAIFPMGERHDVFTPHNGGLLVRETLRNELSYIDAEAQITTFLKFDFGKYNVPEAYFESTDPMVAATKLLESDFANMDHFFINDKHSVLCVNFQKGADGGETSASLGIETNGAWQWLKSEKTGPMSIFYMTARLLTPDSDLILLVNGERIKEFADKYPELISGFENTTDNPHLILCRIK